jgi:hypothetical protein
VRGDHGDVLLDQGGGGDRSDAGGHRGAAEAFQHLVRAVAGDLQQRLDGGRAGERHGVDLAGRELGDEPPYRGQVRGQRPPVDRDLHDGGAGGPQGAGELRLRAAVQLHGDAPAGDALLQQPLQDLLGRLGDGRPVLGEVGGPDGPARLGAAGDEPGPAERRPQRVAHPPALGRLQPAAEADPGGGHDDVGGQAHAGLGGRVQRLVVAERHDRDRRRHQDLGATPFEQGGQLLAAPFGGHGHGEAGQGRGGGCGPGDARGRHRPGRVGHGSRLSTSHYLRG